MQLLVNAIRRFVGFYQTRDRDPDVEQAWVRIVVTSAALIYVGFLLATGDGFGWGHVAMLAACAMAIGVGAFQIWALKRGLVGRVATRYLGIVTDITAVTIGMAAANEGGVPVIGVYLWVVVGNGFRFGPRYLLTAYWMSMLGFGLQLLFVPFWQTHRSVGIGLLLTGGIVPIYVLVLLSRLTAQKDAAVRLSDAKSRFVANVSHELRTPLAGVFAVYDLLRAHRLPPDERGLVTMLGKAVTTLKTSVDAVLQMSKLEAGAESANIRTFNLWYFLQQLSMLARPQSDAKGLSWNLQVELDVPATVRGDPEHLSHVLGNLLNNAFKFTHAGSVTLRVAVAGEMVRIEVIDTGIGIPLEHQERLFERFVQVDNSAKRRFGGTGLGTSIARDLTELMGGRIGVASAPAKGSTFWVELPLLTLGAVNPHAEWGRLRTVRVVGPESPSREALIASLRALGLQAETPSLNALEADAMHVLAVILHMPAADAANQAEARSRARGGPACPWLVIAADYSSTQRAALMRVGAADLLLENPPLPILCEALTALTQRLEMPATGETPTFGTNGVIRPLNILLADDNQSNQMLFARILEDAGHSVRAMARGDQAFDVMAEGGVDLAILDLNMPDMTGPDVIKLYRASSVGGTKLPIMILSADATPAARQESIEAGADEFLVKPITAAKLLGAIERLIAGATDQFEQSSLPLKRAEKGGNGVERRSTTMQSTGMPILVDPERVQSLRRIARGDAQFLSKYVAAACDEVEVAIDNLRTAVAHGNMGSARDALHIVEGTGGSIGALALVANCKCMRSMLNTSRSPERAASLAEFSTTYALTKSALLAILQDPRGMRAGIRTQ